MSLQTAPQHLTCFVMTTPSGGVLLSLVLTELVCNMIDRKFLKGFIWSVFGVLQGC